MKPVLSDMKRCLYAGEKEKQIRELQVEFVCVWMSKGHKLNYL